MANVPLHLKQDFGYLIEANPDDTIPGGLSAWQYHDDDNAFVLNLFGDDKVGTTNWYSRTYADGTKIPGHSTRVLFGDADLIEGSDCSVRTIATSLTRELNSFRKSATHFDLTVAYTDRAGDHQWNNALEHFLVQQGGKTGAYYEGDYWKHTDLKALKSGDQDIIDETKGHANVVLANTYFLEGSTKSAKVAAGGAPSAQVEAYDNYYHDLSLNTYKPMEVDKGRLGIRLASLGATMDIWDQIASNGMGHAADDGLSEKEIDYLFTTAQKFSSFAAFEKNLASDSADSSIHLGKTTLGKIFGKGGTAAQQENATSILEAAFDAVQELFQLDHFATALNNKGTHVQSLFDFLDKDHNGSVTAQEIMHALDPTYEGLEHNRADVMAHRFSETDQTTLYNLEILERAGFM